MFFVIAVPFDGCQTINSGDGKPVSLTLRTMPAKPDGEGQDAHHSPALKRVVVPALVDSARMRYRTELGMRLTFI
jgi:hypothetical protein